MQFCKQQHQTTKKRLSNPKNSYPFTNTTKTHRYNTKTHLMNKRGVELFYKRGTMKKKSRQTLPNTPPPVPRRCQSRFQHGMTPAIKTLTFLLSSRAQDRQDRLVGCSAAPTFNFCSLFFSRSGFNYRRTLIICI